MSKMTVGNPEPRRGTTAPSTAGRPSAATQTLQVLIADQLSEAGTRILQEEPRLAVTIRPGLSPQQLAEIIGGYDALVVRSSTKVTKEVIAKADRLKVIGRAGVGLDNVDVEAASKRGIIAMNVPGGNTVSTAEHAFTLIVALARSIPQAVASLKGGKWERSKYLGVELYGKTLGVVGLGKIGAEVAKRAQAFGMRVIASDPYLSLERARQLEIGLVDLKQLLQQADIISVHTPLTDETRHMIGAKELALCKPHVRIINCARGGIVDENALYDAVKSGRVAGAALDVFEQEPPKDHPLLTLDQVIATPHLGASTEEAQVNVAIEIAKQVRDALLGQGVRNAVNMMSVDAKTLEVLEPYIQLAEKLGSFVTQYASGHPQEVKITYAGEINHHDTSPLTVAFIKGLLTQVVGESVNYVNASLLASERGIKVIEAKASEGKEFTNLIAVDVRTSTGHAAVEGTLFSRHEARIVKIDRYYVDALPQGHMIITMNHDQPGIIGQLGSILGEAHINIAGMTFGREKPGGQAITVINVDSPAGPKVVEQIRQARHIQDVKVIKL